MRRFVPLLVAAVLTWVGTAAPQARPRTVRFAFTSDAHYGLTRAHFRGRVNVDAHVVNAALVDAINRAGPLDFVAVEQRGLERFLERHRNITAYFHGNSNWNEFYDWNGPSHSITLHTFRVNSPMKGAVSGDDETRLSFQVGSIDTATQTLTVRECLWNANPGNPTLTWGESITVPLSRPHS